MAPENLSLSLTSLQSNHSSEPSSASKLGNLHFCLEGHCGGSSKEKYVEISAVARNAVLQDEQMKSFSTARDFTSPQRITVPERDISLPESVTPIELIEDLCRHDGGLDNRMSSDSPKEFLSSSRAKADCLTDSMKDTGESSRGNTSLFEYSRISNRFMCKSCLCELGSVEAMSSRSLRW